ncbi:MAG: septum site-determining protein MinD [Bacillota bacterium]|nr:septum site-determining protein MinD [Bacillota bacterium]
MIVITSGKGGVGKTTACANIGVALAMSGRRTLLIDTDTGLRNLDIIVGLENNVVYDLLDVTSGRCDFDKAVLTYEKYPNLYILPTSQTGDKDDITPEQMIKLCSGLKERFDFILIDCPAGIERGFECATAPAEEAIIIASPDKASMRDADKVAGIIENSEYGAKKIYLIINRLIPELSDNGFMAGAAEVLFTVSVKLLGIVPEDPRVLIDSYEGILCVNDKRSEARKAYLNIARRIMGEEVKLTNYCKKRIFHKRYR